MSLTWTPKYSVGDTSLDAQHQELFKKISILDTAVARGDAAESIFGVIDYLDDYVFFHFRYEERYMTAHGYPDTEKHQLAHQGFINWIEKLKARYVNEHKESLAAELLEYLQLWLKNHVLVMDHDYDLYIEKHKSSHPQYEKNNYHTTIH